jgi:N-acyl-D-amino-acid deacylase
MRFACWAPGRGPLSLFAAALSLVVPVVSGQAFDLVLAGGRILDGTGNPWFAADLGIRDGRIVAIGRLDGLETGEILDVSGLYVLPGFIDLHSHAADVAWQGEGLDSDSPQRRAAPNLIAQGITTVAINQDGRSPVDIAAQRARLEENGIGINAVLMVGHGSLRRAVLQDDYRRPATQEEVQAMRSLLREGMEAGAAGLSAGLEYVPGRWSTTDEVASLVEELIPFDGVYIAHQRSEGSDPMWYWPSADSSGPPSLIDAVRETIQIGEQTGARVIASHLKAKGAHYWGSSAPVIDLVRAARERGVRVWGDQYPYTTSGSDGNTVLLPPWALAGEEEEPDFAARLRRVIADSLRLEALRRDVAHEIRRRGGAGRILILDYPDSTFVGQTLAQISQRTGRDEVGTALWIQTTGFPDRRGGARIRGFSMDEQDVDAYAAEPWVATASDAGISLPGDNPVHPRYWGTFPRKIRRYAIERQVQSIPDAVRSATSLPARLLGLADRGLIGLGMTADLTVIDLATIRDRSTAFDPHVQPDGVVHVFLGGTQVLANGKRTGILPGRVLTPGGDR